MLSIIEKLLGDPRKKEIQRLEKLVEKINEEEILLQSLSDDDFKKVIEAHYGKSYKKDEDLLIKLLALVKNTCRRLQDHQFDVLSEKQIWNLVPYDVQLMGAITLLEGKISEMKTGEGKTLVAGIAASVMAFEEKGVHVITVNDYLAKRDSAWMTPLFSFLGFSIGTVIHGISKEERKSSYHSDITYGTNNEFGFDYLRDNMAQSKESMVQRPLCFAIVDEVDSILIDEARTPLIISAPAEESTDKYGLYANLVQKLTENNHYSVDEKQKTAILTEEGISKMEELLGVENIYTEKGFREVHHIEQALRALSCFKKDTDYVVNQDGVVIVDEFTGRLMPGRRYSEGLHQALEAKENIEIKRESKTLASITFQNYFRLYKNLSGMTGTALTEEEEFGKIYGLAVLPIPTNKPITRQDKADVIFKNEKGKYQAIARITKEKYEIGQPVLIGTVSIERSEILSHLLTQQKIPHQVLNAKQHEREADIISKAGQTGSVTIATNMAGRGTDIKLGEGVKDLGGLCIIGSERHESRRIDNQLRGRAGRQGDIGETQFFVSLDDSLMRLFGSDRLKNMMEAINMPDDMPIENGIISKGIENAQKKVEGVHFDRRKHVLQYDDVINRHREIIYKKRREVLESEDLGSYIENIIETEIENLVAMHTHGKVSGEWDISSIAETLYSFYHASTKEEIQQSLSQFETADTLQKFAFEYLQKAYQEKMDLFEDTEQKTKVQQISCLRAIDILFIEHIETMTQLREQVALRAYGQRDPLMEYKAEGYQLFEKLLNSIRTSTINTLLHINISTVFPKSPLENTKLKTNESEIVGNIEGGNNDIKKKPKKIITNKNGETQEIKVGRNDECPCGSGKKYKKCCGK